MAEPPSPREANEISLRDRVLTGTLWMFAMRWLVRLLSVVSVVTLARLLDKEDFGLAAMASAVVALPVVLLELGLEPAIIRERQPDRGHYNTAWTIRVCQLSVVAVCLYFAAPYAAAYYGDARIVAMLEVLALAVLIRGLENFWTVSFRKQMNFHRDFAYEVAIKVFSVIATIALAFTLRSYWALIYGQLAANGFRLALSLAVAPSLPRPTFSHWRLIWAFSQWSLLNGLARYVVTHGDKLILGRLVSIEVVGAYSLAREIAELPLSEITGPANRAFAPGFSEMQHERTRLAWALGRALSALATIAFPIAVGLAVTSHEVVSVMLGDDWASSAPILLILALGALPLTIRGTMGNVLIVLGHVRHVTVNAWGRAISFALFAIPLTMWYGAEGTAAAFGLTESVACVLLYIRYRQHLREFSMRMLFRSVARPALAVMLMAVLVLAMNLLDISPLPLLLVCKIMVGALAYAATVFLLWRLAGQPDGLEAIFVQRISRLRRR